MNAKYTMLVSAIAIAASVFAAPRQVTLLNDGWTLDDSEKVTLPHTWNAVDGADGISKKAQRRLDGYKRSKSRFFSKQWWRWMLNPAGSEDSYVRRQGIYTRTLETTRKSGRRFFLRCDGASITANVYLNGKFIGRHLGAYTAFCYELTDYLRSDRPSELAIVVDNRLNEDIPTTHADFTVYGGIYRDVWLIETDEVCIDPTYYGGDGVSVKADPESGRVHVDTRLNGGSAAVRYAIAGVGEWDTADFTVKDFELWSPERPKVYELTATLADGDSVTVPFGFRSCAFAKDGTFLLNGKPFALRGVNRHQDRTGKGWAVSHEDEDEDFRLIKEMGANTVRTAHYPQSRHIYDLFDRGGIVAWVEVPCTDTLSPTPAFRATVDEMIREMTVQLGNHPSICMWSVYNELGNGWTCQLPMAQQARFIAGSNELFKQLDPSRPTTAASCMPNATELNAIPDMIALNTYPGWYYGLAEEFSKRVRDFCATNRRERIGISEYGAGASVNQHQWPVAKPKCSGPFHPEEYQAVCHAEIYSAADAMSEVLGTWVWAMFDFAADTRNEGEKPGYNDKGLVTADRKTPKEAYYFYQANWTKTPVLCLVGSKCRKVEAATVPVVVFTNQGEVTLKVNGKAVATAQPDGHCVARFEQVQLAEGENRIEVSAGSLAATAVWNR